MTISASTKLPASAALAGFCLLGAVLLHRPELVVIGAPFLLLLIAGLALVQTPLVTAVVRLDRERVIENERVTATVHIEVASDVEWLEVALDLPPGLVVVDGPGVEAIAMRAGDRRILTRQLRCSRWGAHLPGRLALHAQDRFGLFHFEQETGQPLVLRVYPGPEALRRTVRPAETQLFSGNEVSRHKGDGIEFADLRPFVPGDRVRRINWRASARRGGLHVNEFHPERNCDVVLFLDVFTEVRTPGVNTLDLALRAAATLATHYLAERDRVGIISFGGTLRWLTPGMGITHLYRIVESLLETQVVFSYAWKGVDVIPSKTLPPQALVIALTPLLDERARNTLFDLRRRGFDLAIVELPAVDQPDPIREDLESVLFRLWRLRREALRFIYQQAGVPVAVWQPGTPLESVIEEVREFRRYARHQHG